jgi:hypothetical protein
MLDVLMNAEPDPLTEVRVTLEQAWYHDAADSSREAFRNAGRNAGRKIITVIDRRRCWTELIDGTIPASRHSINYAFPC